MNKAITTSYCFTPFEKGNESEVRNLVYRVLEEYDLSPDVGDTDKDLEDIEAAYGDNGYFEEVRTSEGELIGTWGLMKHSDRVCELRKMYLLPDQRGKGLGKQMLERALHKARRLGYQWVELETASVLKEALGLYQRYGFKPHQSSELSSRCDQAYRMELN